MTGTKKTARLLRRAVFSFASQQDFEPAKPSASSFDIID